MPAGPGGKDVVVELLAHDSFHGPAEAGHVVEVDFARAFNHGGPDSTAIAQNQEMCGGWTHAGGERLAAHSPPAFCGALLSDPGCSSRGPARYPPAGTRRRLCERLDNAAIGPVADPPKQPQMKTAKREGLMGEYSIRYAKPEEQRELTRLAVRATIHAGHDEEFIDRTIPALVVTMPMISGQWVQVAENSSGHVVGVVWVTPTALQGIALLQGLYVDPPFWRCGVGRVLFGAAVARANEFKAGSIMINAEPTAEGFYKRMEAIRIGEAPFYFSPETILPQLLYVIPRKA